MLRKSIKIAKINHYGKEFEQCKDNIKKTWKKINELLNKCKNKKEFPDYFLINNEKVRDKNKIANGFNNFFANIGPSLSSEITTDSTNTIRTYMKERIACSFKFNTISTEDVAKICMKLKTKTSTGYDNISTSFLKKILSIIIYPLTLAINQSLCTGVFPNHLKIAKVIPLFKKDDSHILDNYRPISLLPCMSKIFEKVAFIQLYDYFNSNNLFYKSQYGFRSLYSTELASAEMVDRIHKHLDKGKIPISVFLDLSKAFDTLDHEILLTKSKYYGIKDNALKWFQSYLSNRTQYVEFDGCKSTYLPVTTGVPQGSVLGPLLFIIYMNDIYFASDKFNAILFADDTNLLSTLCSFDISIQQNINLRTLSMNINDELQKIHTWLAINKLSLNVKKTKFMLFHHRRRNIENMIPELQINGYKLERVREFNFLGLLIDENLTWDSHIQKVSSKVSRILGVMYRLKSYIPGHILLILYNTMIMPHLQYSILNWGHKSSRLHKLQKQGVRTVTNSKYRAHTEGHFKRLNLLKLPDIYKNSILKFYYKYEHDTVPEYFKSTNFITKPSHEYSTRQRGPLRNPLAHTSCAQQSLRFNLSNLIRSTPEQTLEKIYTHSLQGFNWYIKRTTIANYQLECSIPECYICNL